MFKWLNLHWITRIAILVVLLAIMLWQSRFTWSVHNPMYGWPMPFNNIWYQNEIIWRPLILILDAIFWFFIAISVGYTTELWQRKSSRWEYNIGSLYVFLSVISVLISLGCIEWYFRIHPNNESLFPKYMYLEWGWIDAWFDIGLFTDPPIFWPLTRITIIFGIGCAVFTAVYILCFVICNITIYMKTLINHNITLSKQSMKIHDGNLSHPIEKGHPRCIKKDPLIARAVIWILLSVLVYFFLTSLFPPAIQ
jgi:hypothetical protein